MEKRGVLLSCRYECLELQKCSQVNKENQCEIAECFMSENSSVKSQHSCIF